MSTRKVGFMVYFPPELLDTIDRLTEKGERSAFIVDAVQQRIDREFPTRADLDVYIEQRSRTGSST